MNISTRPAEATERISLDGEWRFALGAPAPAFPQGVRPALRFDDTILLPGTTETRNKGPENPAAETGMLTRTRKFDGPAWYSRAIEIPPEWEGRAIELQVERTKYTQVWLDEHPAGEQGRYTAPQHYDLTRWATPGPHTLTIMVDNRAERRRVQAEAHQFSDNTQTNWNGLLGRLELMARPATRIDDVRVFPDVAAKRFRLKVSLGGNARGRIEVSATSFNHDGPPHAPPAVTAELTGNEIELALPLGEGARLWDEFSPALYRLTVALETPAGRDECVVETGLREFRARGTQFAINGRTTFLRGKCDNCVFPLTGHPPMDLEGWLDYLRICRRYGINHIRCHTWVPPEAAFAVADRLGIYLQPELPFWGTFDEKARDFLLPEAEAMLRAYGNHPSFVMLTLGNEIGGDRALMNAMVQRLRILDPRRLYADGSNNYLWDPRLQPTNDFWPTAKTKTPASGDRALPVRGSFYFADGYDGVVQWGPANPRGDLREAIAGIPVPVIGHEIGQYTTYPSYAEIGRYTGVTRARNLERFRGLLAKQGMLDEAPEFARASGKLAVSLYREDIELALRTPGFGGFQLLDLQDFPGQGTALVGVLDAFMESKGATAPEEWRRFCGPVVPLARFDRYTWTEGETFSADLELAHYGAEDLRDAVTRWELKGEGGAVLAHGELKAARIEQGGLRELGAISAVLNQRVAARCELVVSVTAGSETCSNAWSLWVYPKQIAMEPAAEVTIVRAFDARAKALLAAGRRVVFVPEGKNWGRTVPGGYATDFWCWPMFGSSPGTMGLRCDPRHPALAQFPTASSSERQWSRIAHAATPVILTDGPAELRPIVQTIDNLERNEKLGLVFEAKVGAGSLLVVAGDLYALGDAPEARQLLASLLAYAASPAFSPPVEVGADYLDRVLRPSLTASAEAEASSSFKPPWGFVPQPKHAIDGDINTRWQPADDDEAPWWRVDLGGVCDVDTVELLWEQDSPGYRYTLEWSAEGERWAVASDQRANTFDGNRHVLAVPLRGVRHLRISIVSGPEKRRPALREVRVLGSRGVSGEVVE